MSFYVYGYSDPTSTDPYFYIGKGQGKRAYDHLDQSSRQTKTHFHRKLNKMLESGIQPEISFMITDVSEDEALAGEIALIRQYGRIDLNTGCLCNHTDGGEGVSRYLRSDETKEKMRQGLLGHSVSDETREKIRQALLGQVMSNEMREKIRLSNMKRVVSDETREKMRQGRLGRFHSLETRQVVRAKAVALRGRPIVAVDPVSGLIRHEFDCVRGAAKKGFVPRYIQEVLSGRRQLAYGFIWRDA